MKPEYRNWPEESRVSDGIDWRVAKSVTVGVDVGTSSAQAAILCDGELYAWASIRAGCDFRRTADDVINLAIGKTGMARENIRAIGGTGFARKNILFATELLDEVQCHAKGARFMFGPEVRTVVDMGGQTVKAILLYDWDRVRDFMMNDKCATGQGRNLEILCDMLEVPIVEIGELSLDVPADPEPVSTTCWAFADTETIGLLGRPEYRAEPLSKNQIYASHLFAVAWRILGVIGRLSPLDVGDLRVQPGLAFTGGLAKNTGITKRIERALQTEAMTSPYDPMLAGAIGAALLAGKEAG